MGYLNNSTITVDAILTMPIVEALADETQMLKYKLVTLPKGTARIPVVSVGQTTIELQSNESVTITPQTVNFQGGNRRFGYTAILSDSDVAEIVAVRGVRDQAASVPQFIGDSEAAQSITVAGIQFEITAKELLTADRSITILFIGNETGGRASVTLTVKKVEIATTGLTPG